jgi:hypothetical protein
MYPTWLCGKTNCRSATGSLFWLIRPFGWGASAGATIDKGAGISRVAQYLKNAAVARDRPRQIPLLLAHALAARKAKTVLDHFAYRLESRPGVLKGIEHEPQGGLY